VEINVEERDGQAQCLSVSKKLCLPPSMQPPHPRDRRLLVIGDSISVGFGARLPCAAQLAGLSESEVTPEMRWQTEDAHAAYVAVAARHLGADWHAIAYSGAGARARLAGMDRWHVIRHGACLGSG
jgi:hypothetical protein